MRTFDDEQESYKRKPKHSPNVKGQGMRILNAWQDYEEDEWEDDQPSVDEEFSNEELTKYK